MQQNEKAIKTVLEAAETRSSPASLEELTHAAAPPGVDSAAVTRLASNLVAEGFLHLSVSGRGIQWLDTHCGREGWPITELDVALGHSPPERLTPPDGQRYELKHWYDLLVESARWLIEHGKLGKRDCPYSPERARKRYLVHTEPRHPDGAPFGQPKPIGDLWVETKHDDLHVVQYTIELIFRSSCDANDFVVSRRT